MKNDEIYQMCNVNMFTSLLTALRDTVLHYIETEPQYNGRDRYIYK